MDDRLPTRTGSTVDGAEDCAVLVLAQSTKLIASAKRVRVERKKAPCPYTLRFLAPPWRALKRGLVLQMT